METGRRKIKIKMGKNMETGRRKIKIKMKLISDTQVLRGIRKPVQSVNV
jgi:hypothetical protein